MIVKGLCGIERVLLRLCGVYAQTLGAEERAHHPYPYTYWRPGRGDCCDERCRHPHAAQPWLTCRDALADSDSLDGGSCSQAPERDSLQRPHFRTENEKDNLMTLRGTQAELMNWSKSAHSACLVYQPNDIVEISKVLAVARTGGLSVLPHGAGHSYTDAALNTGGVVIDLKLMRRILSWDAARGIMRVEPGVTMRDMVQMAWKDGWCPVVSPSTPEVTIGGCTAMNVNGKNAWKCGPFGAHLRAIDVLLASGEICTLLPEQDAQLFHAFVGSMGLLGIITSITVQLQRISSGRVTVRRRCASSLAEILAIFAEEQRTSDFLEAWLDGFAGGQQLGRGYVTCAALSDSADETPPPFLIPGLIDRLETPFVRLAATLGRPALLPGIRLANRANDWLGRRTLKTKRRQRGLLPFTYWPSAAFAGYHALFPQGVETFQAFVPSQHAREIFEQVLRYSQQQGCMPLWCVIKQHRRDPFLLSYQVDGFSLELNYQRTCQTSQKLERTLRHMIALVIEAGGRFYPAKDHFLTHSQYRQSVGDEVVDTFLGLKQLYDPETLLQSDLFRRLLQPSLR
jgi:decaprenylphospho-beta-D-ribofuranose 2-oxidase